MSSEVETSLAITIQRRRCRKKLRFLDFARNDTTEGADQTSRGAMVCALTNNPNVLAMWNKFFAICDCVPFRMLAEAEEMFPNFETL